MTKQPKPDNPYRIKLAFDKRHATNPAQATVLVMQRFAARVCEEFPEAVLKGGLGLELRLDTPRTTKDADIIIAGSHDLPERLRQAGLRDIGDFMRFRVEPGRAGGLFIAPGMPYPAHRFTVQAFFTDKPPLVSEKPYRSFKLEVSIRKPAGFDPFNSVWEGFEKRIPGKMIRVYSLSWQIAEKVHAYTDPRHRESTNRDMWRPRDLLDLCRCAIATTPAANIDGQALRLALEETFAKRKAAATGIVLHDLPDELPTMPVAWEPGYREQVIQASLPWPTPAIAHALAATFIDPVLKGNPTGTWHPGTKTWGH